MQVETLSIFCAVVRHQSFSRAARANSVSQSAASQAVRQLEKHLGAQLIDRSKRPWQLTSEGHLFFKGCQELVERYRDLEQRVRRRQNPSGHTVRLGAIYSVGVHDLTQHVDRFRERVPGAGVDLKYMHPDEICERVLSDRFDLGLISFVSPRRELTAILWKRQPMVVTFPPTHRFVALASDRGGVRPSDLSQERFVAFDRELPVRREIDRFLRRHRVDVSITAEFDNIETIKQAVDEDAGIAILPEATLRQRQTLVQAPFILPTGETPLVRPLSIVRRRNRRLNPAVTEFIKLLGANPADMPPSTPTTIGGRATNDRRSRPPRHRRSTPGDAQGAKV